MSTAAAVGVLLCLSAPPGLAQAPAAAATPVTGESARPSKSVRGKLESIDAAKNIVVMRSDEGGLLSWSFEPPVIVELAKFAIGSPMIVIYRQISANSKRVTAVAFPGTAQKPTYLNMTGDRIRMRSGPFVNGVCGDALAQPVSEHVVPAGGLVEALEDCWCCSADSESCTPGNRTGIGKAVVTSCFK